MITLMTLLLFMMVFGRLMVFALEFGWGMCKIAAYLIFLPAVVLLMIFGGLFYIALPILLVIGLVGWCQGIKDGNDVLNHKLS